MLAKWLEPLPDGTYPNINIARDILTTVNSLQIDSDNLQRSQKLGRIVKAYADGSSGMTGVQGLAKSIMDKWSRMVF